MRGRGGAGGRGGGAEVDGVAGGETAKRLKTNVGGRMDPPERYTGARTKKASSGRCDARRRFPLVALPHSQFHRPPTPCHQNRVETTGGGGGGGRSGPDCFLVGKKQTTTKKHRRQRPFFFFWRARVRMAPTAGRCGPVKNAFCRLNRLSVRQSPVSRVPLDKLVVLPRRKEGLLLLLLLLLLLPLLLSSCKCIDKH